MTILDWYLGRVVAKNILIVLLVMLVIQFFTLFVQEMSRIDLGYQMGNVVIYTLLYLPVQAYEMLPVILLIGAMIGFGALANGNELTIIRATGRSIHSITLSVAKTGIPLVLLMFAVGEFLALPMVTFAEEYKAISLGKKISLSESDGFWIKDRDIFINVKGIQAVGDDQFSYYRVDKNNRVNEILTAERSTPTDDGWLLSDVSVTTIGDQKSETKIYPELNLKTEFDKEGIGKLTLEPRDIKLFELYGYAQYLAANDMESNSYFFSFWHRVLKPISALGMLFLALPFVFGSLREKSITQRVMTGVFLGVGFFILSQTVNHLGIIVNIPGLIGAAIPTLAIIGLWLYLQLKADRPV